MQQSNVSVVSEIAEKLRRDISLGLIKPGERLNIEALKRKHEVSHPSVREALSLLSGEGYVLFEEQKGFRVLQSSFQEQQDTARVRAELEAIAIGWSIERSTRAWRSQVVAAHYALSEVEACLTTDPVAHVLEWDEMNRAFHLGLASNCGSPKLMALITAQYDVSRRYRLMAHGAETSDKTRLAWVEKSSEEHNALKTAALDGHVEVACQLLRDHIQKSRGDKFEALDAL